MKLLDVISAKFELFGIALGVPTKVLDDIKSNPEAPSCLDKLKAVIKLLGEIPMAQQTWRTIHEAVIHLGRRDIAGEIKQKYQDLGMCKLIF